MSSQEYYQLYQELDTLKSLQAASIRETWTIPIALITIAIIPVLIASIGPVIKWILLYWYLTRHHRKDKDGKQKENRGEIIDI